MAELQNTSSRGSTQSKRHTLRLDMTPMVDLAFLLLTFFVLSATFNQPKSIVLNYPEGKPDTNHRIKNGITFLLSSTNQLYCYEGEFNFVTGQPKQALKKLSVDLTLATYIQQKNAKVIKELFALQQQQLKNPVHDTLFQQHVKALHTSTDVPTFLIKPDYAADYKVLIDVLDELNAQQAGKYMVCDLTQQETKLINH